MPATRVYLLASCVVFLCAGIIATTLTKWADLQHAADASGTISSFEHPFFQTLIMFCGETLCLVAYRFVIWRKQRSCVQQRVGIGNENQLRPIWFAVPAIADFTASTICNIALTMTSASVYQMLRGSTVLFIAVFSHIFLQRRFFRHEYLGMVIVTSGLLVVGVSASLRKTTQEASNPVLGNILVIVGQLIQSIQFVLEEAWMKKYRLPPLMLVGWEGIFGVCITGLSLAVFQAFDGRPDDVVVALQQIGNCWQCALATALVLLACAVLNAAANTVTKEFSAASRTVLDTLRNIFVWATAMIFASTFNEEFDWLQMFGFACLVAGGAIYRRIIRLPHSWFDITHVSDQSDTLSHSNYSTLVNTDAKDPEGACEMSEIGNECINPPHLQSGVGEK
jgi:drug/metabolite transporter (DMT)-like permease